MKNKVIFGLFVAFFAIVLVLNTVTASDLGFVEITKVKVNDIVISAGSTAVGEVSETVPVEVQFKAKDDLSNVKVKVYIEGYRDEISEGTSRFHVVDGSTYVKRFSLTLPSSLDLDNLIEDLSLLVRISASGEDSVEESYDIRMQKDLYSLNVLSVEAPESTLAGSSVAVDVVIQNNGNERLDNVYVRASIPDLGVERQIYVGDLGPNPEEDEDYYDEISDAKSKRIYLSIPRNSIPGIYNLEVEAFNYDALSVSTKKKIAIDSIETGILPAITAKAIAAGEETTFDVVLVNPNDRMVVYSITPEESKGLIVEVTEPIVTVPSDSSKTVKIRVKATDSVEEGTHVVSININSETGLVKQVSFTLNVEEDSQVVKSNAVVMLTVILAIVFVVLLIVLIVLLTKRPTEPEEFGETSYY